MALRIKIVNGQLFIIASTAHDGFEIGQLAQQAEGFGKELEVVRNDSDGLAVTIRLPDKELEPSLSEELQRVGVKVKKQPA